MVKFGLLGAKTSFDIPQAAAISELSEQQAKELIPTRKVFDVTIALVAIDADLKLVGRKEIQKLRQNTAAKIHRLPPAWSGKQPIHAKKAAEN
jgi:translation elongation factor EF-4